MKISIDIDDKEMQEVIEKGVKNLSDETVSDLAKNAISEYLSSRDVVTRLAFETVHYGTYDSGVTDFDRPRKWFTDLLRNVFTDEDFRDYRKKFVETLESNRKNIIINALGKAFSECLVNQDMSERLYIALKEVERG